MGGITVQFAHVLDQDTAGADGANDISLRYNAGPVVVAFNYNKQDDGKTNKHLGARYNFGAFTVGGAWIDPDGADKGYAIGVSAPMGAFNFVLDYVKNTSGAKNATTLAEVKYSLSKRTTAYAAYRAQNNDRADQLGLGVRHNF
jgi:predicted porin